MFRNLSERNLSAAHIQFEAIWRHRLYVEEERDLWIVDLFGVAAQGRVPINFSAAKNNTLRSWKESHDGVLATFVIENILSDADCFFSIWS